MRGLYSEPVGFCVGVQCHCRGVQCEWAVCWSGCLLLCAQIISAPDVVPGPVRGHLGELPTWNHSPLSQAPDISFMAKLGAKRPPSLHPYQPGGERPRGPMGRGRGGAHIHKLCFGSLRWANAFSGGCPTRGGEPWKKGFKSSPL